MPPRKKIPLAGGAEVEAQAKRIDKYVGSQLKKRRQARGLSQTAVAEVLGITFQQVQKYEQGTNRIAASRLWDLARFLGVPIEYFYEGLDGAANKAARSVDEVFADPNVHKIVEACAEIPQPLRANLNALLRSVGRGTNTVR